MAKKKDNGANLGFEATLWAAADKLRNNMDVSEVPKPHLFVGIAQQGILIGRWEAFVERFRKAVYPGNSAPEEFEPNQKALAELLWDTNTEEPHDELHRTVASQLMWEPLQMMSNSEGAER
ncbi:MAG: hypothetical protein HUJ26_20315 [Planctomycetaceae bacterium]|nr:hypothetical protein [Planctomycetaceae bacterium]